VVAFSLYDYLSAISQRAPARIPDPPHVDPLFSYVVYIPEQDALRIIQEQAEAMGVHLVSGQTWHVFVPQMGGRWMELDLMDEENNIAFVLAQQNRNQIIGGTHRIINARRTREKIETSGTMTTILWFSIYRQQSSRGTKDDAMIQSEKNTLALRLAGEVRAFVYMLRDMDEFGMNGEIRT
jgi:hypothetical protein